MQAENISLPQFRFTRIPCENLTLRSHSSTNEPSTDNTALVRGFGHSGILEGRSQEIVNLTNRIREPGCHRGQLSAWTVRDSRNCTFTSTEVIGTLFGYYLEDCIIKIQGVKGSINLTGCKRVTVECVCSQLRITDCGDLSLSVHSLSPITLVNSGNVVIKPPQPLTQDVCLELDSAGLLPKGGFAPDQWKLVNDFNCLNQPSNNYTVDEGS